VTTQTDALSSFYCAALEWAAGGRGQAIVDAAANALVDGLDTPALRFLAGATHSAADSEAPEWVPKAAAELGLTIPERLSTDAYIRASRLHASRFLADRADPRSFAQTGYRLYVAAGYPAELAVFSGLDDWYDMLTTGVIAGDVRDADEATASAAEELAAGQLAGAVPLGDRFVMSDTGQVVPSWTNTQAGLLARTVPAAVANGRLLEAMLNGWRDRVVARTSMYDLLFTRPGDRYPFSSTVRVAWADNVYSFTLSNEVGVVDADKCFEPNATSVLAAFLCQLVGGEPE
jgi:hypothetical protein